MGASSPTPIAQRIFILFMELPGIMRLGVLILVIGAGLDLCYHAVPAGWAMWMDRYLGSDGTIAHLVTLLGMVVTLLGLFAYRASMPSARVERIAEERRPSID